MHKKHHEKMWNNTDKAYLKFINNCVIIILQIAIDCKTKRICQDYLKEQADCRDGKRKLKKTQAGIVWMAGSGNKGDCNAICRKQYLTGGKGRKRLLWILNVYNSLILNIFIGNLYIVFCKLWNINKNPL